MRVAVCLPEDGNPGFLERQADTLCRILKHSSEHEEFTIRSGTVLLPDPNLWLDGGRAEREWISASSNTFAALLMAGCSEGMVSAIVGEFSDAVFPRATVINSSEVLLLKNLHGSLVLDYRVAASCLRLLYLGMDQLYCPGDEPSMCSMSVDPDAYCENLPDVKCGSRDPAFAWVDLHGDMERLRNAGCTVDMKLESLLTMDSVFDKNYMGGDIALQIEIVNQFEDPWLIASVLNWMVFVAPRSVETLHALVLAISQARTGEQAAQAGLSTRRLFEQLADALYSSQVADSPLTKGSPYSVKNGKRKNQLQAALEYRVNHVGRVEEFGRVRATLEDMTKFSDESLHHHPPLEVVAEKLDGLAELLNDMRELAPPDQVSEAAYLGSFDEYVEKMAEQLIGD